MQAFQRQFAAGDDLVGGADGGLHDSAGVGEDVGGAGRLTLYWTDCKDTNILPYPLDTDEKITDFVWNWLSSAKRGIEPDIDGHCTEDGFSLRTFEQDGYRWQMALTIAAEWSVHHK
jgi:hypothetical protein